MRVLIAMAVPKHKLEKPSLNQVRKLANQLTPEEQEELYYTLGTKVRRITIDGPVPPPKNKKLDKMRTDAQNALRKAGVTVEELQAEAETVREELYAKDHPDLANAS